MRNLITFFIGVMFTYCLGVLIGGDFDPRLWHIAVRVICVITLVIGTLVSLNGVLGDEDLQRKLGNRLNNNQKR